MQSIRRESFWLPLRLKQNSKQKGFFFFFWFPCSLVPQFPQDGNGGVLGCLLQREVVPVNQRGNFIIFPIIQPGRLARAVCALKKIEKKLFRGLLQKASVFLSRCLSTPLWCWQTPGQAHEKTEQKGYQFFFTVGVDKHLGQARETLSKKAIIFLSRCLSTPTAKKKNMIDFFARFAWAYRLFVNTQQPVAKKKKWAALLSCLSFFFRWRC